MVVQGEYAIGKKFKKIRYIIIESYQEIVTLFTKA